MRRLLPVICLAILVAGLLLAYHPTASSGAVETRPTTVPFPAVWTLQDSRQIASVAAWQAASVRSDNEGRWYATAAWNEAAARATSQPPRPASTPRPATRAPRSTVPATRPSSGRCGGDLPPCSVMMCESGGSLTAHNASGADGKWQIIPSTWAGYGGYARPSAAPEAVQDARARELYAGGAGARQWSCR